MRQRNSAYVIGAALIVAVVVAVALLSGDLPTTVQRLATAAQHAKDEHPVAVGAVSVLVFTVWTLLLPATPLELSIAFLFGLGPGIAIVYVGKMCSAALAYTLARSLLRGWAQRTFSRHEALLAIEDECARNPWRCAFLLRAVYVPLPLKNFGSAALGLPPPPFFGAAAVIEVPDTYFTAAIGSTARSIAELLNGGGDGDGASERSWTTVGVMGVQVGLLFALLVYMAGVAKRAIDQKRAEREHGGGGAAGGSGDELV